MRIVLSSDYLRTVIPGYPDDAGFIAELDSQERLVIWTAGGPAGGASPIAVARWHPESRALEARSGQIHAEPAMSDKVYEVLTQALVARDQTEDAKVVQITELLSKHGLPAVPNDDLPAYLASFSEPVRGALTSGMSAVFLNDVATASHAFQEAAKFLEYGRRPDAARIPTDDRTPDSGVHTVTIRQQVRGEGASLLLDVSSRRQGDLRFEGSYNNPASTFLGFNITDSTTIAPNGEFTLRGTRLSSGKFNVEYIEPGDKFTFRIRSTPDDEFRLYLAGEVVHAEVEDGANLTAQVRHPFGRWAGRKVSIREQAGVRHLRDLFVQLAEDADLNGSLVSVTDAANVMLGRFRAHRFPAFALVNYLLVEHSLYGKFDREGTFSVRTLREEDREFRSQPPLLLHPQHVKQTKGSPLSVPGQAFITNRHGPTGADTTSVASVVTRPSVADARPPTSPPSPTALAIWRKKLDYLLAQEPTTTDPDAKFRLHGLIEEARAKIREYGGDA